MLRVSEVSTLFFLISCCFASLLLRFSAFWLFSAFFYGFSFSDFQVLRFLCYFCFSHGKCVSSLASSWILGLLASSYIQLLVHCSEEVGDLIALAILARIHLFLSYTHTYILYLIICVSPHFLVHVQLSRGSASFDGLARPCLNNSKLPPPRATHRGLGFHDLVRSA